MAIRTDPAYLKEVAQRRRLDRRKLTQAQAEAIRVAYAGGEVSTYQLAATYGVSQTAITRVLTGQCYKAVEEAQDGS